MTHSIQFLLIIGHYFYNLAYILKYKVCPTVLHKRPAHNAAAMRRQSDRRGRAAKLAATSLQDDVQACTRWTDAIGGL